MKKQCAKCNFTLPVEKQMEDGVLRGCDSLCSHTGGTTRGAKKALRVRRTRMLVPHPCKSRHQREEEHFRVLILSSLESPLLAQRTQQIC